MLGGFLNGLMGGSLDKLGTALNETLGMFLDRLLSGHGLLGGLVQGFEWVIVLVVGPFGK